MPPTTVYRPDDAFRTTSQRLRLVHELEQHSTIRFRQLTESLCSGAYLHKDVAYNDPLFLYLVLRKVPVGSRVLEKLVARFKISLLSLTSVEMWIHFPPKLLMWALFIAGTTSLGADRLWLGELLSQLRMMLHLESWEELKAVLIEYAWVEVTCSSPCKALWDDSVR
jgi:hypothetical protein